MKQNTFLRISIFLVCLTVYSLFSGVAYGAELSLGVTPGLIEITADSENAIEREIKLSNNSEEAIIVDILFKQFRASSKENGQVEFLSDSPLFKHIELLDSGTPIQNITLAPKQTRLLTLRVKASISQPSDFYFSIIFINHTVSKDGNENSFLLLDQGIATNVLLSIMPPDRAEGVVEEFSVPLVVESGPVPFTVRIRNLGRSVIHPTGTIYIKNVFNQTIGKVDLLSVPVLAESVRFIPDSLETTGSNTQHPAALWNEALPLGPHAATITVALSPSGPTFSRTVYFVGLPIKILLGILIGIVIVLFIGQRLRLRRLTNTKNT